MDDDDEEEEEDNDDDDDAGRRRARASSLWWWDVWRVVVRRSASQSSETEEDSERGDGTTTMEDDPPEAGGGDRRRTTLASLLVSAVVTMTGRVGEIIYSNSCARCPPFFVSFYQRIAAPNNIMTLSTAVGASSAAIPPPTGTKHLYFGNMLWFRKYNFLLVSCRKRQDKYIRPNRKFMKFRTAAQIDPGEKKTNGNE